MIAFTYPGQGSQEPAMGAPWKEHPSWEITHEVSEATDRDVAHLLLDADAEELRQTRNSQLASFAMSMIVLDAVNRVGIIGNGHAGHSLGEFSALAASGVLSLVDAAQLVSERGEAMQMASEEQAGTMAAVLGLEDDQVRNLCKTIQPEQVWAANFNSPGQVVVAGSPEAIQELQDTVKDPNFDGGAKKVIPLKVGGAFHTPFMESARDRLDKAVAQVEFRNPDSPVYANVDAKSYDHSEPWPDLISAQLTSPVRWRHVLEQLSTDGYSTLAEIGAGKALTAMAKRIEGASWNLIAVNLPSDIDKLLESLGHPPASVGHGEHLYATERIVVSPRAGVFKPTLEVSVGSQIGVGTLLGHVSNEEVLSPFSGTIMGFMAAADERVGVNQPLAWLQTNG